jgi:hypothetical protein
MIAFEDPVCPELIWVLLIGELLGLMDDTGASSSGNQQCGTAHGGMKEPQLHHARAEEVQ